MALRIKVYFSRATGQESSQIIYLPRAECWALDLSHPCKPHTTKIWLSTNTWKLITWSFVVTDKCFLKTHLVLGLDHGYEESSICPDAFSKRVKAMGHGLQKAGKNRWCVRASTGKHSRREDLPFRITTGPLDSSHSSQMTLPSPKAPYRERSCSL